jgi:hypothetical protein
MAPIISGVTAVACVKACASSLVVNTFIKKVFDGAGVLYEPTKIRKNAKADVDAGLTRKKGNLEERDLERQYERRWQKEDENNASVLSKAIPLLEETAKPDNIDNDWLANLFEKTKIVSDNEMQELWAKVLAGEANAPGKFSRKTINILNDLDKKDAELFTKLCGFVWNIGGVIPVILNFQDKIYNDQGINFDSLSHLETLGLIKFDYIVGFGRDRAPKTMKIGYYQQIVEISLPKEQDNKIEFGNKVIFTQTGIELYSICNSQSVTGFFGYIYDELAKKNYVAPRTITPVAE